MAAGACGARINRQSARAKDAIRELSCTGTGVGPHRMDRVLGVMKAYTTRVGEGAITREDPAIAVMLHVKGSELGATAGRERR